MTASPYRAPRVTTYATANGTIHAVDTGTPATFRDSRHVLRMVCGSELSGGMMLRSSPTADAYVTCKRCAPRIADGITVSAVTMRRAAFRAALADGAR